MNSNFFPVKLTWKSLAGLLATVFGGLTATGTVGGVPSNTATGLTVGGLIVLAIERIADAIDFKTSGGVDVGGLSAALSSARRQLAQYQQAYGTPMQPQPPQVGAVLPGPPSVAAPPVPPVVTPPAPAGPTPQG